MRLKNLAIAFGAAVLSMAVPAQVQAQGQSQGQAQASDQEFSSLFDSMLGTEQRAPRTFDARYDSPLDRQIAQIAESSQGRIGVYAVDLSTGQEVGVLADQRFPMASTSKVAIAAVYLAGVDAGRWSLTSEWRLPRPGGAYLSAQRHIDLMISKSCNACTDAMLEAVGGPSAVNRWMAQAGITDFELTRDIATLVSQDGRLDPASIVDTRDSVTPRAMGQFLAGIHQGRWLSRESRQVILDAMQRTTTGKSRMRSGLPLSAGLAHKTGTLSRTASDIGIFRTSDGRTVAAAIYVTGQSPSMAHENGSRANKLRARANRDERIASIARALYHGFGTVENRNYAAAGYGGK